MKYKVGDKVRVKSLEWYKKHKDKYGVIDIADEISFEPYMLKICGNILTIKHIHADKYAYEVEENGYYWTDDMFEGLVKEETIQPVVFENIVFPNENYADKVELCLGDDYEIVVEDGRVFVQRKKPKYPKTFIEVLNFWHPDRQIEDDYQIYYKKDIIENFQNLLYARDAYWKIAGEEMGLGKSWEPDWTKSDYKFCIINMKNKIVCDDSYYISKFLAFPTSEMRDVFYENFKDLIKNCKELL